MTLLVLLFVGEGGGCSPDGLSKYSNSFTTLPFSNSAAIGIILVFGAQTI
jgi:hypothetical protein